MKTRLTLTIAVAAFVLNGAVVNAVDLYSQADQEWSTLGTFTLQPGGGTAQVPTLSDDVHIQAGHAVTIDSANVAKAKTVDIANDADSRVDMLTGSELQIEDTLTINGSGSFIFGADDTETPPILKAMNDLTINGNMKIIDPADADGGAGYRLQSDRAGDTFILPSGYTIEADVGPINIEADITVNGTVLANGSNTDHKITITGEILAGSTGLIEASGSNNARVHFDDGSAFDNAIDLTVEDGARMRFSDTDDYVTSGCVSMVSGRFEIYLSDVSLTLTGACP